MSGICFQLHRSFLSVEIGFVNFNSLQVFILIVIIEEVLRHNRVSIDLVLLYLFSLLNVLCLILEQLSG